MYKETFHEKIKKARIDAGYTQMQVSKETGISQTIITYIETGKREPSLENLGILADFYEVSVDWLLGTARTTPNNNEEPLDKNKIIVDMVDYCKNNKVNTFADFLIWTRKNNKDWFCVLCDSSSAVTLIAEYLNSNSNKESTKTDPLSESH